MRMEGAEVAGGHAGESKHTGSDNPGGGFKGLQQNGFFRAMIFIFGALPQAVKIFACTGIEAWPKVWAVMFLGSFLVLEVLVVMAARTGELSGEEVLRTRATSTEVLDRIVVLSTDAIVSLSKLPALFYQGMTIVRGFAWIRHGDVCFETSITVGLFVGSLCMTLFFPLGSYVSREVVMKILLHLTTVAVGNGTAFWLNANSGGNTEDNPWLLALNVGLLFFAGLLGSIIWSSPASVVSERRNKFDKRIGVSFLLMHSLTAWGYHVLKMSNFTQSKKPRWAEYLG